MDAAIERIMSVTDTRQYEEQGDKWVPIPGSGSLRPCDRCGRMHEVHAVVKLTDGTFLTVGTGCMHRDNPEIAKKFQSADRAAKRLAALTAKRDAALDYRARYTAARTEVEALPLPTIEFVGDAYPGSSSRTQRVQMGDVSVCYMSTFDAERRECLISHWQEKRMEELGFVSPRGFHRRPINDYELKTLEKELATVQARCEQLAL